MDERVFAEQLREKAVEGNMTSAEMLEWANELDPALPAPGTPILWRYDYYPMYRLQHAVVEHDGFIHDVAGNLIALSEVVWEPARIAGGNEVVVNRDDLRTGLEVHVGKMVDNTGAIKRLYEVIREDNDETA